MNNLEEAAKLLENGWCVGFIKDRDKFCAVGALAVAIGIDLTDIETKRPYELVDDSPEGKALAEEILESDYFKNLGSALQDYTLIAFEKGDYSVITYHFNDRQESVEPVLEMFKYAAKRIDS